MGQNCWNIVFAIELLVIAVGAIVMVFSFCKLKKTRSTAIVNTEQCKFWRIFSNVLSCAVLLVFISLCVCKFCCNPCDEVKFYCDSGSVVVAAFGVIVTLLIAWDIYKAIDFKKQMEDKLVEMKKQITVDVNIGLAANRYLYYLRSSTAVSRIPNAQDATIDFLSYAIQDYKDVRNRPIILGKIIENIRSLLNAGLFQKANTNTLKYFIDVLDGLKEENSVISDLHTQIENIYNELIAKK
jgi:uncharacterized protein YacL